MLAKDANKTDMEWLRLHNSGMGYAEIAKKYGVSLGTVSRHIKRAREISPVKGVKERKKPVKVSTDDVLRLLRGGLTKQEIAETLQVTVRTVENHLAKANVEPVESEPEIAVEPVETAPVVEAPKPAPDRVYKKPEPMPTDPFKFAACVKWIDKIYDLADMAQPEPWGFPAQDGDDFKFPDIYILINYINRIFSHRASLYNAAGVDIADEIIYRRKDITVLHTGLYTPSFMSIYMVFTQNRNSASPIKWFFLGFLPEGAKELAYVRTLPKHLPLVTEKSHFNPDWPIRVNADHILCDESNRERLPEQVKDTFNLPLLLETAVEMSRRKAFIEPGIVVRSTYQNYPQFVMPLYLTNADTPDLAMTLEECDGYYVSRTCLTLKMAYKDVRPVGRPTAKWLTDVVEKGDSTWLD